MDELGTAAFREMIWEYYREHGRHDLPWRTDVSPYGVLVSEVMLQQTQVSRVRQKYSEWLTRFPDFAALSQAPVGDVIAAWQGLGYNRRALRLREAAQMVVGEYATILPSDPTELVKLPGVGVNTAGSMAAFAYDEPVVFIETNIRRVYIHHFGEQGVHTKAFDGPLAPKLNDKELMPYIEATLDREHPREWYWALMDYGSDLAKRVVNPNRKSEHYVVQPRFEGSRRQIRGEVLRQLLTGPKSATGMGIQDARLAIVLEALVKEGFVSESDGTYALMR